MTGLGHEYVAANHSEQVLDMVKVALRCDPGGQQVADEGGCGQLFPKWKRLSLKAISQGARSGPEVILAKSGAKDRSVIRKFQVTAAGGKHGRGFHYMMPAALVRYEASVREDECGVSKRCLITVHEAVAPSTRGVGRGNGVD